MKRLVIAILIAWPLAAQTAKYPTAVATDADLMVARNRVSTTLSASITAGATSLRVASATNIVVNMLLTIDSEIVKVTGVSGTTLTVTRAFDSTTAAAHSVGRPVEARIAAWHHNAIAAEVKAIQTTLGANMVNVPGGGDVDGPASAVDGEMPLYDGTTGKLLKRSALTGVLKSTSGVPAVVTGAASDCVLVDGSSGSCGVSTGDVSGPASAVDSNFASFDGVGGKTIKDSGSKAADFATSAHNHDATYAPLAKGVTNGDTHNHAGGDGAAIAYTDLSGTPSTFAPAAHTTNHKHGGSDEVATATAGANLIPKAEAAGTLALGWIPTLPNSKTTAASANTASAIVARDASGNFSAGTITATLTGTATGLSATLAEVRFPALTGDVTNSVGSLATTVASYIPKCVKYTVAYSNAAFIAASTTAPVTLFTLPARGKILGVNIKHSVAYAGTGISSTTVSVGDGTSTYNQYAAAYDIFQAVAATAFQDTSQFKSTTMASSSVVAYFTANVNFGTGAATVLTAGSVDIAVCWVTLP